MRSASLRMEAWLRVWMMRPWWKVKEQKLQPPKQPRHEVRLNFTSWMAGTPPCFL